MKKRISFSLAFIIGGIITILIMLALQAFGKAMAGMSDGAGSDNSDFSGDVALILICLYFFASALGIFVFNKKIELKIWSVLVHLLLVVAFLIMCTAAIGEAIEAAMMMTIYFTPWFIAWFNILNEPSPPTNNIQDVKKEK